MCCIAQLMVVKQAGFFLSASVCCNVRRNGVHSKYVVETSCGETPYTSRFSRSPVFGTYKRREIMRTYEWWIVVEAVESRHCPCHRRSPLPGGCCRYLRSPTQPGAKPQRPWTLYRTPFEHIHLPCLISIHTKRAARHLIIRTLIFSLHQTRQWVSI